jgi:sec-independent protein translocase protein TatA
MGDMAQGIKAFKKGMSEDDTAKTEEKPGEPMKTINAGTDMKQQAETQKKFEGTV